MTTTCERKARYATEGLARKVATKQSHATGDVIAAYACADCGGWHVGHPRLKAPRAVRARARRR
jgi:L-aminopeptidase/D-esterase-like protein